ARRPSGAGVARRTSWQGCSDRSQERAGMTDTIDYHRAHESYIAAVVDALNAAGISVADWHADPNDPRDAAIRLGDPAAVDDDDFAAEVWICWDEESGWFRG